MGRPGSRRAGGVTLTLLRHITSLGCVVSVFRIPCGLYGSPGHVEMTALDLSKDPPTRHTAKVLETEEGDLDYRCA
jgi:hypothetical protein